jgi:hypothetical protein
LFEIFQPLFQGPFLLLQTLNFVVLGLNLPVLLEEFVQEHGVDGLVPDGVYAVFPVVHDQIRVHLFDLLEDQAELGEALRINIRLVLERDRLSREKFFNRAPPRPVDRVLAFNPPPICVQSWPFEGNKS